MTQPGQFDHSIIKVINDKLYVCNCGNNRVQVMNSFGCYGDGVGRFRYPTDITQDRAGNLYVTDTNNNRVQVFDCKGQFLSTFSKRVMLLNN